MPNTNLIASNFRAFIVLSALVGAAIACGSSGSNGSTSTGGSGGNDQTCSPTIGTIGCSCNLNVDAGTGICTDTLASATYQGSPYCNQVTTDGDACSIPGVAATTPCPTTNLVGTCFSNATSVTQGVTRYYSPTFTTATAEAACWSVPSQCFGPAN